MISQTFLILLCLTGFFACGHLSPELAKSRPSGKGKIYKMNPDKNTLIVSDSRKNKIFFCEKDYTKYVTERIKNEPLTFASAKVLIFGADSVHFNAGRAICSKGTIFIPGNKELLWIQASNIIFDEENQKLTCNDGTLKKINLEDDQKEETEYLKEIAIDLNIKR
jgi:hypothetical protein